MIFCGKIILVTGGTSGIGLTTSINFVKQGAEKVYVCGRSRLKWDIAKVLINKELGDLENKIVYIQTDIRVESQVKKMIREIFHKHNQLDICVNNAGVNTTPRNLWDVDFGTTEINGDTIKFEFYSGSEEDKQSTLFTNLYGLIFCLKWEIKYMLKYNNRSKPVSIVNIASSISSIGTITWPDYAASKAGVVSLTKSVAGQVALLYKNDKYNTPRIYINSISPGFTLTPLFLQSLGHGNIEEKINQLKNLIPLNRLGTPNEISNAILLFANYKNVIYITSNDLSVDGGLTNLPNF